MATKVDEIVSHFDYLEARWRDEQEYENFVEYRTAMSKFLASKQAKLLTMTARPFQLRFETIGGQRCQLTVMGQRIELKVLKAVH